MGCLLVLFAAFTPRLVLFLMWLFSDRLSIAFRSGWIGLLGFLFLPYTALFYALAYAPFGKVSGIGWVLVAIGLFLDLSNYFGGRSTRSRRASS